MDRRDELVILRRGSFARVYEVSYARWRCRALKAVTNAALVRNAAALRRASYLVE